MGLTNFGEKFSANVLKKFYGNALTPAITNSDYEGEIKEMGDRVNILTFLEDIALGDYTVGTDMNVQHPEDTEFTLQIAHKKYYNFDIDKADRQFSYVNDEDSSLIKNAAKVLERTIDTMILANAYFVKAGSFIGVNHLYLGDGADTHASVATTATGGTITIQAIGTTGTGDQPVENINLDGNGISDTLYRAGFGADVVGKAIRLVSQSGATTDWWRITGATSTNVCTVENWDGGVSVRDNPNRAQNGDILSGIHIAGDAYGDGGPVLESGWGYEIQAAIPTTVTASTIYDAIVDLSTKLNENDIPSDGRSISLPAAFEGMLRKAAEMQPDIALYHEQVIINGKVGRVAGFDIRLATGTKCSTRAGRSTAAGADATCVITPGGAGYQILANHPSFITFADKWSESRVKEAEKQFATLYQGLYLYGHRVLPMRRKAGAQLFTNI